MTESGHDILKDAEQILDGAINQHHTIQMGLTTEFGLTPEQATRATLQYEAWVERVAAANGMPVAMYTLLFMNPHRAWGMLSYCAGSVAMHDVLHNHEGE